MRNFFYVMLIGLSIAGCGEIAYKRGASAKELEATKKVCQTKSDDAAIEKCLEEHGWMVQKLADIGLPDSELFATADVANDNRDMANSSKKTEKSSTAERSQDATKSETAKNVENAKPSKPEAAAAPVNEFDTYKINSWWKMGASPVALESDINGCTEKLGVSHQPDRKTQTFTRGFVVCMYNKGWRGLREK